MAVRRRVGGYGGHREVGRVGQHAWGVRGRLSGARPPPARIARPGARDAHSSGRTHHHRRAARLATHLWQVNLRLPLFVAAAMALITLALLARYLEEPTEFAANRPRSGSGGSGGDGVLSQSQSRRDPRPSARAPPLPLVQRCLPSRAAA